MNTARLIVGGLAVVAYFAIGFVVIVKIRRDQRRGR